MASVTPFGNLKSSDIVTRMCDYLRFSDMRMVARTSKTYYDAVNRYFALISAHIEAQMRRAFLEGYDLAPRSFTVGPSRLPPFTRLLPLYREMSLTVSRMIAGPTTPNSPQALLRALTYVADDYERFRREAPLAHIADRVKACVARRRNPEAVGPDVLGARMCLKYLSQLTLAEYDTEVRWETEEEKHCLLAHLFVQSGLSYMFAAPDFLLEFSTVQHCFTLAAFYGDHSIIEQLLPKITNHCLRLGFASAAKKGHLSIINLLLQSPSRERIDYQHIKTGFIESARFGHIRVVQTLLDSTCGNWLRLDLSAIDKAFIAAASTQQLEVLDLFLQTPQLFEEISQPTFFTACTDAAEAGHVDILHHLLPYLDSSKEKLCSIKDKFRQIFQIAAQEGQIEAMKVLLGPSYGKHIENSYFGQSFAFASTSGLANVISLCLEPTHIHRLSLFQLTQALLEAAKKSDLTLVNLLFPRCTTIATPQFITLFEYSINNGWVDIIQTLLADEARLPTPILEVSIEKAQEKGLVVVVETIQSILDRRALSKR